MRRSPPTTRGKPAAANNDRFNFAEMNAALDEGFDQNQIDAALKASAANVDSDDELEAALAASAAEARPELRIDDTPVVHTPDEPIDFFGDGRPIVASTEYFTTHTRIAFAQTRIENGWAIAGCLAVCTRNRGTERAPDYESTLEIRRGGNITRYELHDAGAITQQFVEREGHLVGRDKRTHWLLVNYNMCWFLSMIIAERGVWVGQRTIQNLRDDWYEIDQQAVNLKARVRGEEATQPNEEFGAHDTDLYIASDCTPMTSAEISRIYEKVGLTRDIITIRRLGDDYEFTAWIRHDAEGRPRTFDIAETLFIHCYMHGGEHFMPYTRTINRVNTQTAKLPTVTRTYDWQA